MKPLPLSVLVMSLFLMFQAHARLGETPAQIEKRYGAPLTDPDILGTNEYMREYRHAGYNISVIFWNGKSAEETVRASDSVAANQTVDEETAPKLFKSIGNCDCTRTNRETGTDTNKVIIIWYHGTDTNVTGCLVSDSLDVYSKNYLDTTGKQRNAEKQKKLDSF